MKYDFLTDSVQLLKAETSEYYEVEGLASTSDKDLQDEIIEQKGLDFDNIEYFNADHGHEYEDKPGGRSLARMGLIDSAKMTKKGLWIKGKIFKNHPESAIYYNELKYGKPGLVQFSIEGSVVDRDPFDKRTVKKCKVKGVALTRNPVNTNTYASLVKSMTSNESIKEVVVEEVLDKTSDMINKEQYEVLEGRYDALSKGHKELSTKFFEIVKGYEKTLEEITDLRKSVLLSNKDYVKELIQERIKNDPDFRNQLKERIENALNPGGPQYATSTPDGITGGNVFMTESLGGDDEEDEKKKKMKKKALSNQSAD